MELPGSSLNIFCKDLVFLYCPGGSQTPVFKSSSRLSLLKCWNCSFNSVCQGTHILFREFSFVQATPHNRVSFLRAFWRCFRTVGKNGDLLTMKEYHCLLQLLCPDFPLELTQKAARIVLMDDAMDCLMSFSDFLFAFQIQFYYSEFLDSVAAIYEDLLSGKNPNTVIVPTSSSGQHRQRPALGEAGMLEGVEASLFYQCLENLCDRHKYSCPPPALVKEALSNVQRLTFYGFLMALSKHHGINQALGALPDKGDLMHDPAMDEELERLNSIKGENPNSHAGPCTIKGDTCDASTRRT
ncbi:centriolar satellite-associated tubulin polyglutamylase complex regulator 1 isoform X13 [Macaca fascicularis]|uniref:centriolar satellite-associated tubulin polyglutamylase complex regulator 1 isoform X13 n=1 Tax=Macaca fascicularis TaxID=9541 RepID=UPI003D15ACDE